MRRAVAAACLIWLSACGSPDPRQPARPIAAPVTEPLPATLEEIDAAFAAGRKDAAEAGLRALANGVDSSLRRKALTRLARYYEEEKRYTEAAGAWNAAAAEFPSIEPFLELQSIRALRAARSYTEAIAAAEALVASSPSSSAGESARLELIALDALAGNRESAAARLEQSKSLTIDSLNESEFVSTADLLASSGATDLASSLRFRILDQYPQSRSTEAIYQHLVLDAGSPLHSLGYQESLELADRIGRVNRYDQALDLLARIEQRFPKAATDPAFRYTRVVSLFNSRQYPQVIAQKVDPDEPYYLDTQLRRARAYWRIDQNAEFVKLVRNIIARYPKTPEANEAKLLLSKYHLTDDVDHERAARLLSEVISAGNLGADGENLWTLGWIYVLDGKDERALSTFADYLKRYPDADYTSNSLFWSGKVHARNGRTAERDAAFSRLVKLYPYSYFSYRARELAKLPPPGDEVEGGQAFPLESENQDRPELVPIRELMEAGLQEFAAREMQRVAAANPQDRLLAFKLADLYVQAGEPLRANVLLQRTFRDIVRHGGRNVPRRFWEILYPLPYRDTIESAAAHSNVDPFLIAAITRQESGFNPDVVSNAGAVGLMQIMPAEASRIAVKGGLPPITRSELFDPEKNIRVGAAEIRQKLDAMNGNFTLAVASYNAGEDAVGRWIAKRSLTDIDLFIESISYAETRLYVKSVTRNLFEYRRIYGGP